MKNYNLGIDLGTTNSVIAYGNLGKDGSLKTQVLEVERRTEEGGLERRKTLPSVVLYNRGKEEFTPVVGEYAKAAYGKKYGYVSKSIKSIIGLQENSGLNDQIADKTPQDVCARILKHIIVNAKKHLYLDEELKDVVITIPASFEPSQRQATIEAARIAGIDTENTHDILLYEPKAVIYNLVNLIDNEEIPSGIVDISIPKNILVFDLGGGTLDVTLHNVGYKNQIPYVEDIAISRYTQIGGDNFDELIAEDLLKRFEKQCEITIPPNRKNEVMCRMRKIAERLKIEVSQYYDDVHNMEREINELYDFSVDEISLFDDYSFSENITLKEFKEMFSSLMGRNLKLEDVDRIDQLKKENMNNIIYPVLDTLAKAKVQQGNLKVDYIILNGGMTKFYPIKERIDEFFNLNSICITNPDLAVAQGAAYYHYCLHKYNVGKNNIYINKEKNITNNTTNVFNTSTILNDTLSIGLKGEYILKLVEAGEKLPYKQENTTSKFILKEQTDKFVIELFSGRGKNKNLPNIKIASKVVILDSVCPAGTEILINVKIDTMKFITLELKTSNSTNSIYTLNINGGINIEEKVKKLPRLETINKIKLNPIVEINNLKSLSKKINKNVDSKFFNSVTVKIDKSIKRIIEADNPCDFFEVIFKEIKNAPLNDFFRGYLYKISASFINEWEKDMIDRIYAECEKHFQEEFKGMTTKEYIVNAAIDFFEKCDYEKAQKYKRNRDVNNKKYVIK